MEEKPFKIDWFSEELSDGKDWLAYASVYKSTVKLLLESFKKELSSNEIYLERDPDVIMLPSHALGILPILLLFRQYVELHLKGLLKINNEKIDTKSHEMYEPLERLEKIAINPNRISANTKKFIKKLEELDVKSQAFRYPTDVQGNRFFKGIGVPEDMNILSSVEKLILQVMDDLENVEGDFGHNKENEDEWMNYYRPDEEVVDAMKKIKEFIKEFKKNENNNKI